MLGNILIDTNILCSLLLQQNDYANTEKFFAKSDEFNLQISVLDFSIYSICLLLTRRQEHKVVGRLLKFIENRRNIKIYRPNFSDINAVADQKIKLDFEDGLHYYLAKKKNLTFISYDSDFDKTDLKRLTPSQALTELNLS
ncbi:MAG: PIN domain-containing protein [Patescibacteria group bacterium]